MFDLLIAARAVHLAATSVVAGGTLFVAVVAQPAFDRAGVDARAQEHAYLRWMRPILWIGLVLVILSGAAWLAAVAANIGDATVGMVLVETRFGHVWIGRFLLAAMLLCFMARSWPGLSALAGMGLMASLAWSGHAASSPGGLGDLHRAADVLHLCACAAWLGGLAPLGLLIMIGLRRTEPSMASVMQVAVRRFSTLALWSVATLLATGLVNLWVLVGSLSVLLEADYGRLVLLKIALFGAMVVLAAINRVQLTPALPRTGPAYSLARNAFIELGLGLAIIFVVSILGLLPPTRHMGMGGH